MSAKKHFYITTTLPYVNAKPHIGHAMEFIRADIVARYHVLCGDKVFFNTGTDEHGSKVHRKAVEEGIPVQEYVDNLVKDFLKLKEILNLYPEINFIRTTDPHHKAAAQEFWRRCMAKGDIYKKTYQVKYCVGCELEKTDSELENGHCPLHPNLSIELIDEENFFFRFSKYEQALLDLYKKEPSFVLPDFRFNEIKAFVERGLQDFSISRLKTKMPWGIDVPDEPDHVMYVWFDALVNYISAIGWPERMDDFDAWWPVTQYAGKDNLRQQSAMWQAMLMSAGLPPSKQIVINGFITGEGGVKMSKSLGNVVSPFEVIDIYGTDALRYFVAAELLPFEDSPFTFEIFKDRYNSALANGFGNLSSRILKMASNNSISGSEALQKIQNTDVFAAEEYASAFETYELNRATGYIWKKISEMDKFIGEQEPFKKIKVDKASGEADIRTLLEGLAMVAMLLLPFLPQSAQKVLDALKENRILETPLFPRKE